VRGAHHAVNGLAACLLAACGAGAAPPVLPPAGVTFTAEERAALAELSPTTLPAPPADVTNQFANDPRAAALGQKLFFDKRFSGRLLDGDNDGSANTLGTQGQAGRVACAGCHVPQSGFLDDRTLGKQISLAAGWGRRRAPSLLDVGQARLLMWDGRRDALFNQPFGALESPVEMNSSRLFMAEQVYANHRPEYEAIFGALPPLDDTARFPALSAQITGCQPTTVDPPPTCNGTSHGLPGDGTEFDGLAAADQQAVTRVVANVGKALGAYERLLTCGPGRFDAWMRGQGNALDESEQRGARLFVGRGKCAGCHGGPFFSDQKFHNVGLKPTPVAVVFIDQDDTGAAKGLAAALVDPLSSRGVYSDGDDGRLPAAVLPEHTGAFRTPTLRCGARRPSFMHTGQLATLEQVVAFFARGGDPFGYPGKNELAALDLTPEDEQDLVAFLKTLDGPGPAPALLEEP